LKLPLKPLPPRALLERPALDPRDTAYLEILGRLLPWLGLPLALAWLVWIWLQRRYVLRRAEDPEQDPLASLAMHTDSQPLFAAPPVRDALRRLHQPIEIPGRSLDTRATITASIRRAGFFHPIRRGRRFAPEVLVLIDTRDPKDLLTGVGRLVAARLRQQGHQAFVYTYQGAPNGFVKDTGQGSDPLATAGAVEHPRSPPGLARGADGGGILCRTSDQRGYPGHRRPAHGPPPTHRDRAALELAARPLPGPPWALVAAASQARRVVGGTWPHYATIWGKMAIFC